MRPLPRVENGGRSTGILSVSISATHRSSVTLSSRQLGGSRRLSVGCRGEPGWLTFLAAVVVADGDSAVRRRFRGKPSRCRSLLRPLMSKLTNIIKFGNVRMLARHGGTLLPKD